MSSPTETRDLVSLGRRVLEQEADIGVFDIVKDGFCLVTIFDDQVKVGIEWIATSFIGNGLNGFADDIWAFRCM